ncbi:MAG: class II aldolase/adducin family protein [Microthrixaceae bacterium]
MSTSPPTADLDAGTLVAIAGRILDREGCAPGVGGQISRRDPSGRGFHVAGFELLGRIDPARVGLVDENLRVVEGDIRLPAALGAHARLYRERPDVHSVIHLHSHHVAVLSSTGSTVGDYHVSSALFSGEQVVHADDGTAPHSSVVDTLGSARVAIVRNHGAIVASDSLEHAVVEAVTLESCARLHLECVGAGGSELHPAEVDAGRRTFRPHYLEHMWEALLERTRAECPELFG